MATDLMSGYLTYTNPSDIVAEAYSGSVDAEAASISVTVSVTVSLTATAVEQQ